MVCTCCPTLKNPVAPSRHKRLRFEVLMASFAIQQDEALTRLGALVHHLDFGGIPTAEGPGFAAVMTGARALQPDDDALLEARSLLLHS
jgi:hypothetical protein